MPRKKKPELSGDLVGVKILAEPVVISAHVRSCAHDDWARCDDCGCVYCRVDREDACPHKIRN